MNRILLLLALLAFAPSAYAMCTDDDGGAAGPSWTAASAAVADVQDCVDDASNGHTIHIPSGSATWTVMLSITKGLKILGATCTLDGDGLPTSGGCGTVITDGHTGGGLLISWTLASGQAHELGHIKFVGSGRSPAFQSTTVGIITITGTGTAGTTFRWHHTYIDTLLNTAFYTDTVRGVFDHNRILMAGSAGNNYGSGRVWSGSSDVMGHYSWSTFSSSTWGTADFTFWEDNEISYPTGSPYAMWDSNRGFRGVYRFNKCKGCEPEAHGTDTGGNDVRGTVGIESYGNIFDVDNVSSPLITAFQGLRSGSGMIWGNDFINRPQGFNAAQSFKPVYNRTTAYIAFGIADGDSQWDANDAGNPFNPNDAACTATDCTASSGGQLSVTVGTANFTSNEFQYWILHKKSCSGYCSSVITSHDATTFTLNSCDGHCGGSEITFAMNDVFELQKITEGFDAPGRVGGTLLSGSDWTMMTAPGPNDQVTLPIYAWLNRDVDAASPYSVSNGGHPSMVLVTRGNEHFYNYDHTETTSMTNQTEGVRSGTFANRPGSCTTGVFYWATDVGSWRTATPLTGYTGQGLGYKCTSTDTWSLYYTPATYPHSLVDDAAEPSPSGGAGSRTRMRVR